MQKPAQRPVEKLDDPAKDNSVPLGLCAAVIVVLLWSLIGCHDFFTWSLEVVPALIGIPLLIYLYPRYRFTNLVYSLIAVHATILMIGGHYTYALMPLFEWIKNSFHLDRNYYDRFGHFAQGFVPAFIAREVLLRWTPLARGKLLTYLVFSCCMAITALYELFEFAAAKATGTAADAFLGSQGDVWDTQWDMTWCLIGAVCMLLFFSRVHDRALLNQRRNEAGSALEASMPDNIVGRRARERMKIEIRPAGDGS